VNYWYIAQSISTILEFAVDGILVCYIVNCPDRIYWVFFWAPFFGVSIRICFHPFFSTKHVLYSTNNSPSIVALEFVDMMLQTLLALE